MLPGGEAAEEAAGEAEEEAADEAVQVVVALLLQLHQEQVLLVTSALTVLMASALLPAALLVEGQHAEHCGCLHWRLQGHGRQQHGAQLTQHWHCAEVVTAAVAAAVVAVAAAVAAAVTAAVAAAVTAAVTVSAAGGLAFVPAAAECLQSECVLCHEQHVHLEQRRWAEDPRGVTAGGARVGRMGTGSGAQAWAMQLFVQLLQQLR